MKKIISLDIGTSSMLAALYDEKGNLVHKTAKEYHSDYFSGSIVEQDTATWLESSVDVLSRMNEYLVEQKITVAGIAVTSQRSSLIPVDQNGSALRTAIMWQDKRTIPQCDFLEAEYGLDYLYKKTGLRINPYFVLPKILWLREHQPELYRDAYKFIGVQDLVVHQLTGEFKTEATQGCRTMLMNIRKFEWDQELLEIAGIEPERLPELHAPGTIAGKLTAEFAKQTGLPPETLVIMSGGDQQNAALALGVIKKGRAEANTGTGSFVISAVDEPAFEADARILCQAAAIPGKWIMEAGIFNTGATYRWFAEQFYQDVGAAENIYEKMNEEARNAPAGSNGLVMIPHFQGSAAPFWNPRANGLFFNLSLDKTRGDFTRAIMEGVAIEIGHNLRLIQKLTGEISKISVAGGMTRADLFCEIQANTYNRQVYKYQNSEASSLGAAMLALVTLGVYGSIEEAYSQMVEANIQEFSPQEDLVKVYDKINEQKLVLYDAINIGGVYRSFMEDSVD